jgi:amidophosphoribosyltransferase
VRYPNVYGIDMPAASELVAHGRTELQVQELIGADWLVYQDLDDLIRAVRYDNGDIKEFDNCVFGSLRDRRRDTGLPGAVAGRAPDDAKNRRELDAQDARTMMRRTSRSSRPVPGRAA